LSWRLFVSEEHALVGATGPIRLASCAPIGGGVRDALGVVNMSVPKDFALCDLSELARRRLADAHLPLDCAVMFTAARIENAVLSQRDEVACAITAGLSNAASIGHTSPCDALGHHQVGTINIILLIDAILSDACLINTVQSAAEAKCAAVMDMGVLVEGERATGTTTDCVAVGSTQRGRHHEYAGSGTVLGHTIGRLVRRGVRRAVALQDGLLGCE